MKLKIKTSTIYKKICDFVAQIFLVENIVQKSPVSMGAVGKTRGVPIFKNDAFVLKPLMAKIQNFYHLLVMGLAQHNPNFKNLARFPEFLQNKNPAISARVKTAKKGGVFQYFWWVLYGQRIVQLQLLYPLHFS